MSSGSLGGSLTGALVPPAELGEVGDRLGLRLQVDSDVLGGGLPRLAGLAVRRNPRRAHLLVSRLLGKHLPVVPSDSLAAAGLLARQLPPTVAARGPLVLGFAETATGLGHAVAAALPGATYVSSTRRPGVPVLEFEEEHSHATAHRVLAPVDVLSEICPVVLVDDELSTGRTAINTIRALHALAPRPSYVVAALLDLRPDSAREAVTALADELGVPISVVSLLSGRLDVPEDAVSAAAPLVAAGDPPLDLRPEHSVRQIDAGWPVGLPLSGRRGWRPEHTDDLDAALGPLAETVAAELAALPRPVRRLGRQRLLVLGTEELMYVPMRLAATLAAHLRGTAEVRSQSTTRSPVVPLDRDGYAVRCALRFAAPDEPSRDSLVYNVAPAAGAAGGEAYDAIVVVCDPAATRGDASMLETLAGCAPVVQARLPEVEA